MAVCMSLRSATAGTGARYTNHFSVKADIGDIVIVPGLIPSYRVTPISHVVRTPVSHSPATWHSSPHHIVARHNLDPDPKIPAMPGDTFSGGHNSRVQGHLSINRDPSLSLRNRVTPARPGMDGSPGKGDRWHPSSPLKPPLSPPNTLNPS